MLQEAAESQWVHRTPSYACPILGAKWERRSAARYRRNQTEPPVIRSIAFEPTRAGAREVGSACEASTTRVWHAASNQRGGLHLSSGCQHDSFPRSPQLLHDVLMRRSKRAVRRLLARLAPALIVTGLSLLLIKQQGLTQSSEIAVVAGTAVALITWITDLSGRDPADQSQTGPTAGHPADDLANQIRLEWEDYLTDHSLHKPPIIDLKWKASNVPFSEVRSETDTTTVGGGHDSIPPNGQVRSIASTFTKLMHRRLVILGTAGAGKTVTAIHLTVELLRNRSSGDPVPVLLPLATWNPQATDLYVWIVQRLSRDYYATKTETPLFLLRNRLILPILDGLDDIPENLWPEALHAIDRATHANLPLVLTCRTDEYSRAVVQAGTTLVFSVAIEIQGVEVKEALRYLRESTPLDPGRWDGVEERQAEHPDGALAAALSSPLLVYLMRVAYSRRSANPTELAAQRFRTPERLQRHLLGNYVPSLYQEVPARPWQKRKKQGLDSRKATVASHAIAAELSRNKTIEFNWWALGRHFSTQQPS